MCPPLCSYLVLHSALKCTDRLDQWDKMWSFWFSSNTEDIKYTDPEQSSGAFQEW